MHPTRKTRTNAPLFSDRTNASSPIFFGGCFGELFISKRNNEFDSICKFAAKELDNETNYTYFGARYGACSTECGNRDISIWLSVDPLSDKYPHQSNYMYCSGRPIIMIDPDGRDEWNVCSQTGKMTWIRESDKDVLFITYMDKRTGEKSKEFDKKSIHVVESNNKDQNGVPEYTDISFKYHKTGQDVFDFLADNTGVEWSRVKSKSKITCYENTLVFSSHKRDQEHRGPTLTNSDDFKRNNILIEFEHSHKYSKFYVTVCIQCSSPGDRDHKDEMLKYFPDAKFHIRYGVGQRREYTKDTSSNYGQR